MDAESPPDALLTVGQVASRSGRRRRVEGRRLAPHRTPRATTEVRFPTRRLPIWPALHHARRVLDLCQENGIGDWDLGLAYEALARAYAVAGAGDRVLLLADLETIPGQPRYW